MQLELRINNQIADIDEDTEVSLTKEFQDESELERKQVEYSYELELPITQSNQKIFGYANDIQVKHKFYQVYNAQLYADHILVLDGKFMLTEVDKDTFTGNLYVPSTKTLSDILGEMNLNEIMEYDIELSRLSSFQTLNEKALTSKDAYVCFPYMLYNFTRSNFGETTPNEFVQLYEYKNSTFDFANSYPAYNVCNLIKQIFKSFGYEVSGNIFNDERFTEMWMSASFDTDDYKTELNYPQYMRITGNYYTSRGSTIGESKTIEYIEKDSKFSDDVKQKYYAEDILHSNMTNITVYDNEHDIFQKSGNQGSIVIRRSGWYLVNFRNSVELLNKDEYSTDKVLSKTNTFANTMVEMRLVKGNARDNTNWYSQFGQSPFVPRYNDSSNQTKGKIYAAGENRNLLAWSNANTESNIRIPQNGRTGIVHDYSNFSTSNFICGTRYGNAADITRLFFTKEYINPAWTMFALPNPDTNRIMSYDWDNGTYSLPISTLKQRTSGRAKDLVHWYDLAVALVSENCYTKQEGYSTLRLFRKSTDSGGNKVATGVWEHGIGASSPYYIESNSAYIIPSSTTDETNTYNSRGESNCVVYLEEGDTLNIEALTTANWIDDTKAPNTYITFDLGLGLVSADKDWSPNNTTKTIPYYITSLRSAQTTNINKFLPDMTCNDFLEGFMETFNLRVTKIDDKEYSINYSDLRHTSLNIVPLDDYYDPTKVTEKSVDLPSEYVFKFSVDEDEEGYVSGDNSPFNTKDEKDANEKPQYDASKTIVNNVNTTGDSEEIESKFSYNWYKTIWWTNMETYKKWVDAGKPNVKTIDANAKLYKVPVIADASVWDKSFEDGQDESEKTSATTRFFYLDKNVQLNVYTDYLLKTMYVLPKNSYNSFDLDFNSIPSYTGIEDTFFSTVMNPSYEIYVEMSMSNEDYARIQENTLIKLNGELFRVVKIDGHDVARQEEADVVLKAMV